MQPNRYNPEFRDHLTLREIDVLTLLERRMTNLEIARTLVMSPNTVKFHLKSIFSKLDVCTRHRAVEQFRRMGPGTPPARSGTYGFSHRVNRGPCDVVR